MVEENELTTIQIDGEVWNCLRLKGKKGDSFNSILRKELGLEK